MGTRKVRSALYIADRVTASTSVTIGGAEIVAIETPSADATVSIAGGMVICASPSTYNTYKLPKSTAGTVYYIYFSAGPNDGVPGTNAVATHVIAEDATNTRFAVLRGAAAGNQKKHTTRLLGTTGDHCMVIAQTSSQWNVMSMSSGMATSSGT